MDNQEVLVIYWQECFEADKKTNSDSGSVLAIWGPESSASLITL